MEQITRGVERGEVVRVGVDLAKRVIQVHAVNAAGQVRTTRALKREQFIEWCAGLPEGCVVAMEASSGAHHWARKLQALGLDARIMSADLVSPYRLQGRTGKNDANDAAAICEAASRPQMRFVPVKSVDQQSMLCVHRLREGVKADRTACINRIRGLLAEFGLVYAQGAESLRKVLSEVLEDASNELGALARLTLQRAQAHWRELDEHLAWCDERIAVHAKTNPAVKTAATLLGIGPVTASAVVATVGDFKQFKSGAQFGAWLGLTPRQHSSGGKARLGGITKRGDTYVRTLLVQGAKSAVMTAHGRQDRISQWAMALRERSGWQKAVVALANKNARILWAVMTQGEAFDANHLECQAGLSDSPCDPRSNFHARREDEEALNRSDRQRASSTNPSWPRWRWSTRLEWSPAERFASGSAPRDDHTFGATRPSVERQSVLCPVLASHHLMRRSMHNKQRLLIWEVPVKG